MAPSRGWFWITDLVRQNSLGFGNLPGATRSFASLSDAALENGCSRIIHSGIHYHFSNLNGMACGQEIGRYAFDNCTRPMPAPGAEILVLFGMACLLRRRPRLP